MYEYSPLHLRVHTYVQVFTVTKQQFHSIFPACTISTCIESLKSVEKPANNFLVGENPYESETLLQYMQYDFPYLVTVVTV